MGCSKQALKLCPSVSQFLEDYFGYSYGFRWYCVLILAGFVVFFRVCSMLVLKLVNHQHR